MADQVKQPDVEIIPDEPDVKPDQLSEVVVDLDQKPVQKQADQPKPQPDPKLPADISKLHNTIAYQNRKLEQAMRELQETKAQIAALRQPTVQQAPPQSQDEIDELAQRDWKLGVKKVVEKDIEEKVQAILKQRDDAQVAMQRRIGQEQELERSKQRVYEKYPAIEEPNSEESSIYRQVLNEDNSLLSNVHGPEIAMYRMEDRMRAMGKTPPSVQPLVDKEVQRLARAGVSSVVGRQASPNGKITLTKDQKEFCDHYKIPYERYAQNLKAQTSGEGVQA